MGLSGKSDIFFIAGAAIFALALPTAGYFWFQNKDGVDQKPVGEGRQISLPGSQATTPTTDAPKAADQKPVMPSFDIVRIDRDGASVIAGKAQAGFVVSILLDGKEVGKTTADKRGDFVAMLELPNKDSAQVITLKSEGADGTIIRSDDTVMLAPAPKSDPSTEVATTDQGGQNPTPKQPAIVLANKDGVKVLQPSSTTSGPTRNVVIDAISYDELGQVQLAGRSKGTDQGGHVRVYLDNFPILTTQIGTDGTWQTGLPDVDSGVYTLRIDQVNAKGEVISRTETPFKRVTQNARADADPSKPAVRSIIVQPGSTLWAIARESYGSGFLYVRVFEANRDHIRNPHLIYPGQVFEVPQ